MGSAGFQDLLGSFDLAGGFAVDGEEDASVFDSAFVAFGFVLGDAHAYEGSDESSDCSAYSEACQGAHDGAGCDERAYSGDGERSDAGEEAEGPTYDSAGGDSGGGAFRGLGVFLVGEVLAGVDVGHEDGYVLVGEAGRGDLVDCLFCCGAGVVDSEDCCVFTCHLKFLPG